jgi:hypothetical protein
MLLSDIHIMSDIRELWSFRSFRLRIFMAIAPTLFAVIVGYFAMDRTRPYVFHEDGSAIIPPSGHGGDQITVVWRVTQFRTCPGTVERQLIDPDTSAVVANYDPSPAAINGVDVGGGYLRKTFALPRVIQKGWIEYQAKLNYQCNWLQAWFPNAFGIKYTTPKLLFKVEED